MNEHEFSQLVKDYGHAKAVLAVTWFYDTTSPAWRAQLQVVPFLGANEILWNPGAWS